MAFAAKATPDWTAGFNLGFIVDYLNKDRCIWLLNMSLDFFIFYFRFAFFCCFFFLYNNSVWPLEVTGHFKVEKVLKGLIFLLLFYIVEQVFKRGVQTFLNPLYLLDVPFLKLEEPLTESLEGKKTAALHFDLNKNMYTSPKISSFPSLTHLFALIFGILKRSKRICCCQQKLILLIFFSYNRMFSSETWYTLFRILCYTKWLTASACMCASSQSMSYNIPNELYPVLTDKVIHTEDC